MEYNLIYEYAQNKYTTTIILYVDMSIPEKNVKILDKFVDFNNWEKLIKVKLKNPSEPDTSRNIEQVFILQ